MLPVVECRRRGLSASTCYKFGIVNLSNISWLQALGDKNAKLKKLFVETILYNVVLTGPPDHTGAPIPLTQADRGVGQWG